MLKLLFCSLIVSTALASSVPDTIFIPKVGSAIEAFDRIMAEGYTFISNDPRQATIARLLSKPESTLDHYKFFIERGFPVNSGMAQQAIYGKKADIARFLLDRPWRTGLQMKHNQHLFWTFLVTIIMQLKASTSLEWDDDACDKLDIVMSIFNFAFELGLIEDLVVWKKYRALEIAVKGIEYSPAFVQSILFMHNDARAVKIFVENGFDGSKICGTDELEGNQRLLSASVSKCGCALDLVKAVLKGISIDNFQINEDLPSIMELTFYQGDTRERIKILSYLLFLGFKVAKKFVYAELRSTCLCLCNIWDLKRSVSVDLEQGIGALLPEMQILIFQKMIQLCPAITYDRSHFPLIAPDVVFKNEITKA